MATAKVGLHPTTLYSLYNIYTRLLRTDVVPIFLRSTTVKRLIWLTLVNDVAEETPDRFKYIDDITVTITYKHTRAVEAASHLMQCITDDIL